MRNRRPDALRGGTLAVKRVFGAAVQLILAEAALFLRGAGRPPGACEGWFDPPKCRAIPRFDAAAV